MRRRNFLKNASLLTAGSVLAANNHISAATTSVFKSNAKKSFGLQTWSLGNELAPDVPGGLKKVAQMGYSYLELAGYNDGKIGAVPMAEFKKMADDVGLAIVSTHVNPPMRGYDKDNFEQAKEFWKKAADQHAAIEVPYIIQPGQPTTRSIEEVAFVGEVFNEAGKIAKAAGLQFAFHNHDGEFRRVVAGGTEMLPLTRGRAPEGAKMVFDAMVEYTDPSLVQFELDVYWAVMGLQDPVALMRKYPDRIRLLHIKDAAVLGETGLMNFQKIFETAYENKIDKFFVEYEANIPGLSRFEAVKLCAEYLTNASFVR
ncbi:MAG: sugar phosphate isomerase/epimerase [Dysgonamonadaceae bacterium]|jgi:sugar phosphate isomerase/epimerase|nr:sugar phosphate isomerase/epimerase [Dysgonamonadaceae bacterium]